MEKPKGEIEDDYSGIDVKKVNSIGTFPRRRGNFTLNISQEGKLYVIGGSSNQSEYEDFYLLDLKTYIWSRIPYPLKSPLVGHQSVLIPSKSVQSGGILIYGGWNSENYDESLYLIELENYKAKESRRVPKTFKTIKDVKDVQDKLKSEENNPNSRRDHTFVYIEKWKKIVMIGGWNSLQWNPMMVELEVWVIDQSNLFLFKIGSGKK